MPCLCSFIQKMVAIPKHILVLVLAISVLALAGAFTAEFAFSIKPCILCLAQRVPYALAIFVAGFGLLKPKFLKHAVALLGLLFAINTGIAGYQVGLERGWWGLNTTGNSEICTAKNTSLQSIEALYQSMTGTAVGDCAHPSFNFYGVTFALMNVGLSAALLAFILWQLWRQPKLPVE